ncbi:MAG: biopolymer transporter ExbD [Planctomycetota bacterium]|jgi:biopolymer transport protein ExbD
MQVRNVQRYGEEKIELQMTPMIDIVFLLLIFFLLTFKIVTPEGDFNIKMPLAAPSPGEPPPGLPPTRITLRADANGLLDGILLGQRPIRDRDQLRREIRAIVDDAGGVGSEGAKATEVELDCDYNLRYEYVIDAISDISGYIAEDEDGQTWTVKLIEKIKFRPPQASP